MISSWMRFSGSGFCRALAMFLSMSCFVQDTAHRSTPDAEPLGDFGEEAAQIQIELDGLDRKKARTAFEARPIAAVGPSIQS
jgi:hypothetical protein